MKPLLIAAALLALIFPAQGECYVSREDPLWTITEGNTSIGYGFVWKQGDKTVELAREDRRSAHIAQQAVEADGRKHSYLRVGEVLVFDMTPYDAGCPAVAEKGAGPIDYWSDVIVLPPFGRGSWSSEDGTKYVEMLIDGRFSYSGDDDRGYFDTPCRLAPADKSKTGFEVSCDNGVGGRMLFYDGMTFKGERYRRDDEPRAPACDTYTSELWDPGIRTATYSGEHLHIVDRAWNQDDTYRVISPGTGFPYLAGINEKNEKNVAHFRVYKGMLIINMEIFVAFCAQKR
jgi:hypothetical protein